MCGITAAFHFGEKANEPVNKEIMETYEDQYQRGQEGFGLIEIGKPDQKIKIHRATEPIKAMIDLYMNPMTMGVFHHRSPTSTINSIGQTHPMEIEDEKLEFNYATIHNGVVRNAEEMYKKHKEANLLYRTAYHTHYPWKSVTRVDPPVLKFNDSESLAIELALYLEGKEKKVNAYGAAAFIVIQCTKDWKPLNLYFGKNNEERPLKMYYGKSELYLSSEGKGNMIEAKMLYKANLSDPLMLVTKQPIDIAEEPVKILTPYNHNFENLPHKKMCSDTSCREKRIEGTDKCALHCDPKFLMKQEKKEEQTKAMCIQMNCWKKRKGESKYCKKHKHLENDAENEDAKTEIKAEAEGIEEQDYTTDEPYILIDNLVQEYFELLDNGMLPDYNDYGDLVTKIMARAYDITAEKMESEGIEATNQMISMGDKAVEAENYIIATEIEPDADDIPTGRKMTEEEAQEAQRTFMGF